MRLILWLLAMREVRMARFEKARSALLMSYAEQAIDRSRDRMKQADSYAHRAGYTFGYPRH